MNPTLDSGPEFNQALPQSLYTGMECVSWRPYRIEARPTMMGYADFMVPSIGLEIRDCTLHSYANFVRVEFPQRTERARTSGKIEFRKILILHGRHVGDFQSAALKAWRRVADAK